MIPTHITVIFGDSNALIHTGVGPDFRRVTIALSDDQRRALTYQAAGNESVHVMLLETLPNAQTQGTP